MIGKRIAIFLPSLNGGGAERVMVTLANAFVKRGYEVDLVLATAQGPYLKNVNPEVRIVDLKARRVVVALLPLVLYFRRERPSVMLAAMTHANVIAILARMLAKVSTRLIVSERSTITLEISKAQGLVAQILFALVPKLYRRADRIIVVSHASAADFIQFSNVPPDSIEVIYNPFELKHIQKSAANTIDHPWFAPGQPPVVLGVGRLTEQKDFSNLIHAFANLRGEGYFLKLLILGEGELRSSLEKLVIDLGLTGDDVQMPGFVPNPFAYLARCNVFVLSSRWEGLPGALIEAMVCGAPVVCTDCPSGPREILENGRWGTLVPVGDVDALARAIDKSLSKPRSWLPDVRLRAEDFEERKAVDAYLKALALPEQMRPR
jgi:glycosyltransferase involved in cell wall biosynthesis